jgi:hypothetical protein
MRTTSLAVQAKAIELGKLLGAPHVADFDHLPALSLIGFAGLPEAKGPPGTRHLRSRRFPKKRTVRGRAFNRMLGLCSVRPR